MSCAADRMRALLPTSHMLQECRNQDVSQLVLDEERLQLLTFGPLERCRKIHAQRDYTKSVQDLYTTLVTMSIHHYSSLDIICVSHWRMSGTGGLYGLAMWVLDSKFSFAPDFTTSPEPKKSWVRRGQK